MTMSESEQLIRRLYAITADLDKGFEHQVTQLLELGCERFNLDIGILSNITGEKYTVINRVCPPAAGLEIGAEFELGSTYCARTIAADGPVGFDHVKESDMCSHPAYKAFGLEAYIGIPVKVNGRNYGTLNFSSPLPHERKFSEIDIDALGLMASWLGTEIQRRDYEAQLKTANAKLISYAENLSQQADELHKARLLSDEAVREKSKFLATMSHEIRTPLNGVLGMAELLTKTRLDTVQADYVRTILGSGSLLLSIINDILDYSKLEAGKVELEHIAFNLEWLVYDVLEMMARTTKKNIQLVLDYQSDAPRQFLGDPDRIQQMLFNLIGNAVKFTKQGHVRLAVQMNEGADNNVTLVVEDTGIGMSEEQQRKLFEPFSQADLSTTRKYGGTGLGLAICQQLLGLMHGRISIRSALNQGTTFEISLPLPVSESAATLDYTSLQGIKVLLIDQDQVNRKVIQQMLLQYGARVTVVSKPALVLTALQEASNAGEAYRVLIQGLEIPDQAALSLIQSIRANQALTQPAVLVISSADQAEHVNIFEAAGFSACLNRPVRSDIFQAVLEKMTGQADLPGKIITKHSVIEAEKPAAYHEKLSGHILLVEDNQVNQMVALSMLNQLGLSVDLAEDGYQAIEHWKNNTYNLIFMDCQMPNMDGYEATRQIRRQETSGKRTPIVALTANALEHDKTLCLEAGMDDVITKPFMPEDLVQVIEQFC